MAAAFQRTSRLSRGHPTSTSPRNPICQERFATSRHQMNSRTRLANPAAAYSTTSSDPSLDAQTVRGDRFMEEGSNLHREVAEPADDDADADADSEAESDTSQYFDSGSEDNDGPEEGGDGDESSVGDGEELGTYGWIGYGRTEESRYTMGDQNDTTMTNMEPPPPSVFTQSAPPAITNSEKKPRRCKLSRKHYGADGFAGTQRSIISPAVLASGMDIDMDAPAEEDRDNYYNDSSADEDFDGYAYSSWFGGIYHPMWLGHTAASGKKRRDNGQEDDAGNDREDKAAESGSVAEVGERHIKLPSLSRRKRAWKASQGTRSSVGESEWSLTVNHPMPQSTGSNAGVISSPPMTPVPIPKIKQVHAAPRNTQSRHRQNPARALERRLENLRVEDLNRQSSTATTISTTTTMTPAAAANDWKPRVSSDQHENKRLRYQQTTELAITETPGGGVVTPPVFWDIVEEQPIGMDFSPSGEDGQWDAQGFEMIGIETSMSSAMDGVMQLGVSERAKDISRILDNVDAFL